MASFNNGTYSAIMDSIHVKGVCVPRFTSSSCQVPKQRCQRGLPARNMQKHVGANISKSIIDYKIVFTVYSYSTKLLRAKSESTSTADTAPLSTALSSREVLVYITTGSNAKPRKPPVKTPRLLMLTMLTGKRSQIGKVQNMKGVSLKSNYGADRPPRE
jgi:hypothetical protein